MLWGAWEWKYPFEIQIAFPLEIYAEAGLLDQMVVLALFLIS